MTTCEPMTSYHFPGTGIENANVPEWVAGYPSNPSFEGGAKRRSTRRSARRSARRSTRRSARRSARRSTRRSARRSTRRKMKRSSRRSQKRSGRPSVYKQGRDTLSKYNRDSKGRSLSKRGIRPNKKSEKVVRGARNQKRPSASYYYKVLNKPEGFKIYYRPKKSGKQVLHVLKVKGNGVPYWKAQK